MLKPAAKIGLAVLIAIGWAGYVSVIGVAIAAKLVAPAFSDPLVGQTMGMYFLILWAPSVGIFIGIPRVIEPLRLWVSKK